MLDHPVLDVIFGPNRGTSLAPNTQINLDPRRTMETQIVTHRIFLAHTFRPKISVNPRCANNGTLAEKVPRANTAVIPPPPSFSKTRATLPPFMRGIIEKAKIPPPLVAFGTSAAGRVAPFAWLHYACADDVSACHVTFSFRIPLFCNVPFRAAFFSFRMLFYSAAHNAPRSRAVVCALLSLHFALVESLIDCEVTLLQPPNPRLKKMGEAIERG